MPITIAPELETKLDEAARRLGKPAAEIADDAIRARLEEIDADALAAEDIAYHNLYPELRLRYPRQVVAIYAGRVVDADPDFETLFLRIQPQFGDRPVLMRRVDDSPVDK